MCDLNYMTAEEYLKSSRIQTDKCQKSSAMGHVVESRVSGFEVIAEKIGAPRVPRELLPNSEWCSKLCHWFAYFRSFVSQNSGVNSSLSFDDFVKCVDECRAPCLEDVPSLEMASKILSYFERKQGEWSKNDLCWIFIALARVDTLLTPDMGSLLQSLFTSINGQLSKVNDMSNELYTYLAVVHTILAKYFNQC